MSASLYDTLGVSKTASADEIKKAYRRLARKYHPDINKEKSAEEKFKEINAAYEILSDKEKKAKYDQFGDSMFGGQSFSDFSRGAGAGADLNDILNSIFGGGSRRSSGGFGGFSGFGGGGFSGFSQQGFGGGFEADLNVEANIFIPFKKAVLGGEHVINYNNESIKLKIPHGIKEGEKLRVKGRGKAQGGGKGDLILIVKIQEDEVYTRKGDDLYKTLDISLYAAIFGQDSKDVSTPRKDIKIKIPKDSKNGQKIRLKGYGVQNRKSNLYGDMYLTLNVLLPLSSDISPALKDELSRL